MESKGWKAKGVPLTWSGRPSYELARLVPLGIAIALHTCAGTYFLHAIVTTNNWLGNQWDKRLSKTGLCLVTVEQVGLDQEGALTPGTHQYEEPGKHSRACKLAGWRFWHCCPFDNLHRTGWMAAMAPARPAQSRRGSRKAERNHKSASLLTFHNWVLFSTLCIWGQRKKPRSSARKAKQREKQVRI